MLPSETSQPIPAIKLNSAIDWNEIKLKSNCGFDFSWIHSSICELRAGAISFIPVWIDRCSNWRQQLNLFYCGGFQLQLLIPHSQSQFELCLLISETAVWVSEIKKAWNERKPEWIMMAWMNAIQAGKNDCCWSEYEMNEREKKKAEWKDWLNWKFSSIPERMNN